MDYVSLTDYQLPLGITDSILSTTALHVICRSLCLWPKLLSHNIKQARMSMLMQLAAPRSHTSPSSTSNSKLDASTSRSRKQIISIIQKCKAVGQITPIHSKIIKNGQGNDYFIVFELLRVCCKCDAVDYALKIFEQTREPNVYLYTAIIDGLVWCGSYYHGINLYVQMLESFVYPDNFVLVSVLKACALELELRIGKGVQGQGLKLGLFSNRQANLKLLELYGKFGEHDDMERVFEKMPDRDVVAMTVMISSYFDHKLVEMACSVFDLVQEKDTVCYTAMIDGLVRNGEMSKALKCFRQMQREGLRANEMTIVCVLSASAQLGTLDLGKWIHSYIRNYNIHVNHFVGSALVNMYSRCGCIEEAERVFEGLKHRDVSTYNSMIVGFALNGKTMQAVEMFQRMVNEGTRPTSISFVGVLNACNHGGLVDLGLEIFKSMQIDYCIEPQLEHYGCVVDLLGRAGELNRAFKFIKSMKISPCHITWGSLLSACKVHRNYELGEKVAKILLSHGSSDTGTYVLISNFYSSWGKWEEALFVRTKLKESGIQKEPGCSSIEVSNEIHEFLAGDIRHPQKKAIYEKLEEMNQKLLQEGYSPRVDSVTQDIKDQEKKRALAMHSERLAISFGLISTEPFSTLRILKNLRVCDDCHEMIKLMSKITGRKIILRDRKRFHHFENGSCSCGDHW